MEKSDTRPEAGDSDAAQAEPAGAQAVPTGEASEQDVDRAVQEHLRRCIYCGIVLAEAK